MYTPQFAAAPFGAGLQEMHVIGASHQCWSCAVVMKHTTTHMLLLQTAASAVVAAASTRWQLSAAATSEVCLVSTADNQ